MVIDSSVVMSAFEKMGGDPSTAIESASNYSNVSSWVLSQGSRLCCKKNIMI